jgi:hypothetical protein
MRRLLVRESQAEKPMIDRQRAMDCETGPKDWTGLGARILRAAEFATAVHLAERAQELAGESAAGGATSSGWRASASTSAIAPGCGVAHRRTNRLTD